MFVKSNVQPDDAFTKLLPSEMIPSLGWKLKCWQIKNLSPPLISDVILKNLLVSSQGRLTSPDSQFGSLRCIVGSFWIYGIRI